MVVGTGVDTVMGADVGPAVGTAVPVPERAGLDAAVVGVAVMAGDETVEAVAAVSLPGVGVATEVAGIAVGRSVDGLPRSSGSGVSSEPPQATTPKAATIISREASRVRETRWTDAMLRMVGAPCVVWDWRLPQQPAPA